METLGVETLGVETLGAETLGAETLGAANRVLDCGDTEAGAAARMILRGATLVARAMGWQKTKRQARRGSVFNGLTVLRA